MLRVSRIVGVARLLFESGHYFVQYFWRCGDYFRVATDREWHLIERIRYVIVMNSWRNLGGHNHVQCVCTYSCGLLLYFDLYEE